MSARTHARTHTHTHTLYNITQFTIDTIDDVQTITYVASKALPVLISWLHAFRWSKREYPGVRFCCCTPLCSLWLGRFARFWLHGVCVHVCRSCWLCVCRGGGGGVHAHQEFCLSKFQALIKTLWLSRLFYIAPFPRMQPCIIVCLYECVIQSLECLVYVTDKLSL